METEQNSCSLQVLQYLKPDKSKFLLSYGAENSCEPTEDTKPNEVYTYSEF